MLHPVIWWTQRGGVRRALQRDSTTEINSGEDSVKKGVRFFEFLAPTIAEVAVAEARFNRLLQEYTQLRKRLSNITRNAKAGGGLLSGIPPHPQWTQAQISGGYSVSDEELSDDCAEHLRKVAVQRKPGKQKGKGGGSTRGKRKPAL
jgi:hypothetical protein